MWLELLELLPKYPVVFLDTNTIHQLMDWEHFEEEKKDILQQLKTQQTYISHEVFRELEWQKENEGAYTHEKAINTSAKMGAFDIQLLDYNNTKHPDKSKFEAHVANIVGIEELFAIHLALHWLQHPPLRIKNQLAQASFENVLGKVHAKTKGYINSDAYKQLYSYEIAQRGLARCNKLHGEWVKALRRYGAEIAMLYNADLSTISEAMRIPNVIDYQKKFNIFLQKIENHAQQEGLNINIQETHHVWLRVIHYFLRYVGKNDRKIVNVATFTCLILEKKNTLLFSHDKDTKAYMHSLHKTLAPLLQKAPNPLRFSIFGEAGQVNWIL